MAIRFGLIAAMRRAGRVIGVNGKLPFKIPEDRRYFKDVTAGGILIMGRYTFEEDGIHLPHASKTIVLTTTGSFWHRPGSSLKDVSTATSLSEALAKAADMAAARAAPGQDGGDGGGGVWVVGGERVYEEALGHPGAVELHLTAVDCDDDDEEEAAGGVPTAAGASGSVAKFPEFAERDWKMVKEWQGSNLANCSSTVRGFTFTVYAARARENLSDAPLS